MPDDATKLERRAGPVGFAMIGAAVAAACAVAVVSSDGPDAAPAEDGRHEASHSRGIAAAGTQDDHRVLTPLETAQADDAFAAAADSSGYADFVVKFKGDPDVEEAIKLFRKDEAGARRAFSAWASNKPSLRGLELKGATYSNEALLRYNFDKGTAPNRAAVDKIAERIKATPGVAYCDPDFTAKPGYGRD